jgi:GH25 family lysozyme M1 (1,4-beta-N-acetylmuramidase)
MSMAIDISHWTGEVTAQQMQCLARRGVRRVIVGVQRRAVARQQLATAVAAGIEIEAYVYLYLRSDVARRVRAALETLDGFPVRRLWLDAEDTTSGLASAEVVERLRQARDACGDFPTGIYTGAWWWRPRTGDSSAFSDLPLWVAQYDGRRSLDGVPGFGGWRRPRMKQYAANAQLCGVHLNLNWYADATPRAGDGFPFDHRLTAWDGSDRQMLLNALLEGRVRGHQYVEWRGRTVPSVVILPATDSGD